MHGLWKAIHKRHGVELEEHFSASMNSAPNCTALRPQLELQVKRLNSRILQERRKIGQRKREQIKARVSEGTTAEREAYRMVRDAPAPTRYCLYRRKTARSRQSRMKWTRQS